MNFISSFTYSITDFLNYDFLIYSFIATILLSTVCGLISPLIIARKNAFMGSAISHSSLLGLSIAMAIFGSQNSFALFITTLSITMLTGLFLAKATYRQTLPEDSVIGIFYTSTMAIGIVIHNLFSNKSSDLLSFLFGNILLLNIQDIYLSIILFLAISLLILLPFFKWVYMTFDEDGAIASGLNVKTYHFLFFILLTFLIVSSIKIAGTILIETMLLIPGFFALRFNLSITKTFILSIIFSIFFSILGLIFANYFNLPSGATLAVVQFVGLILSIFFKKIYDLISFS
jgi:ABC-type Mn2+/Zn2+ transport system permease subunit